MNHCQKNNVFGGFKSLERFSLALLSSAMLSRQIPLPNATVTHQAASKWVFWGHKDGECGQPIPFAF